MSIFTKTVELCAIAFKFNSTRLLPRNMSLFTKLAKLFMVRYKVAQEITVK